MNKRRGWSNETEVSYSPGVSFLDEEVLHPFCLPLTEGVISMTINEADQPGEGRITQLVPIGNFLVLEKGIYMLGCRLNGIVLRGIGLKDNLPP